MNLVSSFVYGIALLLAPVREDVGFTGVWERNVEQSDDPQAKMQEAMQPLREQMRGHGPGGGRGRRGGGRGRGESPGRPELGRIAEELTLEFADGELHVDDGEQLRIYYLDGDAHRRETPNGMKLETVAELEGNAIVIEEKMERGQMRRKFELSPDGGTMVMTVSVELGRMKEPVVIRTVYERTEKISSDE